MSQSADVRMLKQQLEAAMVDDNHYEMVALLQQLERLEPAEPRWSQRLGDTYRRMYELSDAVCAYERAVSRFAQGGYLARAVAMAKTITSIDPTRTDILARIQQDVARDLAHKAHAPRAVSMRPPPAAAPASAPQLTPARSFAVVAPDASAWPEAGDDDLDDEALPVPEDDEDAPGEELERALSDPTEFAFSELALPELEADDDLRLDIDDLASDDSEARTAERLAVLPLFGLFAEVPQEVLTTLAVASTLIELAPRELVIRAGDPADALFAIVEGSVRVLVPGLPADAGALLGEGEVFGEACLLNDEPRHADVVVEQRLTALCIPKATLDALVAQHAQVGRVLMQLLVRRLMLNLVKSSPLFAAFDLDTRRELMALFELRKAAPGSVLLQEKKRGDGLYILLTGKLEVRAENGMMRVLPPGSIVGIQSLLSQAPLQHTVRALGDTVMLRLSSARFMQLVTQFPPVLEQLSTMTLTDALTPI